MAIALVVIEFQSGFIQNTSDYDLCYRPMFFILRSGGEFVTIIFFIIGIIITKEIRKF